MLCIVLGADPMPLVGAELAEMRAIAAESTDGLASTCFLDDLEWVSTAVPLTESARRVDRAFRTLTA